MISINFIIWSPYDRLFFNDAKEINQRLKRTNGIKRADFTIFIAFYVENCFYAFSNAAAMENDTRLAR